MAHLLENHASLTVDTESSPASGSAELMIALDTLLCTAQARSDNQPVSAKSASSKTALRQIRVR